jgi:hypothetical protein
MHDFWTRLLEAAIARGEREVTGGPESRGARDRPGGRFPYICFSCRDRDYILLGVINAHS